LNEIWIPKIKNIIKNNDNEEMEKIDKYLEAHYHRFDDNSLK
jgi:hypothetical protein